MSTDEKVTEKFQIQNQISNFSVISFIGTYYLALSISHLLLFMFSLVISYFPYFKLVTLKT